MPEELCGTGAALFDPDFLVFRAATAGAGTAQEAEMDVYPAVPEVSARLVARPVEPTLATAGVLLDHVADVDTSCVVPSEYCARAVNF